MRARDNPRGHGARGVATTMLPGFANCYTHTATSVIDGRVVHQQGRLTLVDESPVRAALARQVPIWHPRLFELGALERDTGI